MKIQPRFTMSLFNPVFPLVMTLLAATLAWLAWRPKPAKVNWGSWKTSPDHDTESYVD